MATGAILEAPSAQIRSRRAYCPSQPPGKAAGEHQISEPFHLPREPLAVSVPPDLFDSGQTIGVHVLDSYHFLQTETAVGAAQAARLYSAMRGLADAQGRKCGCS